MAGMTVGELVAELQRLPQGLQVITEGCDCDGDVAEVSVDDNGWVRAEGGGHSGTVVYLKRSEDY